MRYAKLITGVVTALLMNACTVGGGANCDPVCDGTSVSRFLGTVAVYAGSDKTVTEGDTVGLPGDAAHSLGLPLNYSWTQISGPTVTIISQNSTYGGVGRFVAPAVIETTSLTFRLSAIGSDGATSEDFVNIFVEPTSSSALCLQAPLFATSYAWTNSGCTTASADIAGDSRVATVYRQGEAEPNEPLQSANPLTFPMRIATERTAADGAGSVSGVANDSVDFYVFTPPETGSYEIYLCNDPLVCLRGTKTEKWFLTLRNQSLEEIAGTTGGVLEEQFVSAVLEAGLPYYVGVHVWDATTTSWDYNLTILSAPD
ncbi:MAG: hypothetical protein IID58_08680 [Proteobacteria bacterium]|nr:hypothetical protein [Pseudomonadota bacterium]